MSLLDCFSIMDKISYLSLKILVMGNFINDVIEEFGKYYDKLVQLMPRLLIALVVFVIAYLFARLLRNVLNRYMKKRTEEILIAQFLVQMVYLVMVIIGIVIALDAGGLNGSASSVLAGAGVSAIILGFAFKDIGENFLAGFLLAFKRPFRIGDLVQIEDIQGRISGLSLRETHVNTYDGKDVFIPNSIIVKNPIINYTLDGNFRDSFVIGLDYGDNLNEAMEIIFNTVQNLNEGKGTGKDPLIVVKEFGQSTIDLEVFYWIFTNLPEFNIPNLRTVVMTEVLQALNQAGFYIPASVMEVKNYKSENWRNMTPENG